MSMRYPGGLIASTPVNAAYPSGVWTQAQTQPYASQNVWMRDQYWPYTTLLLQGNGTNGAQNNTFLDSSTNNFTITRNGNTTQGSFTPYEANGYWSNYFNGTDAYLSVPTSTAFDPGSGDFTIEFWAFSAAMQIGYICGQGNLTNSNGWTIYQYAASTGQNPTTKLSFLLNGTGSVYETTLSMTANAWNHVAFVKSSTTWRVYINGALSDTWTSVPTINASTSALTVGRTSVWNANYFWTGYLSNLRILKGTALYSGSSISVPAAPLTAITNTSLLTCQSNRFLDNSTNAFAITVNGTPSVQAFQPFPGATTYSTTVLGGSGYFDGTGDYLSAANNAAFQFGTGDFTVECWVYCARAFNSGTNTLFSIGSYNGGILLRLNGGSGDDLYINGSFWSVPWSTYGSPYTWMHVAIARSGTSLKVFVNGSVALSITNSSNISQSTATQFGAATHDTTQALAGYLADCRIVKGTAVYTAAFTPPTAPLTAIANTSLLLSMTNAGIFDTATMNDLETVGNAQVSTSVVKYGTGSMAFDGSGDYLDAKRAALIPSTGNFTVEAWIYPTSFSNYPCILSQGTTATTGRFLFSLNATTGALFMQISGTSGTFGSGSAITLNTWQHVAVVRNGSTFTGYVNGVPCGTTYTSTDAIQNTSTWVGNSWGNEYFFGNIDDLRVTQAARYSGTFTPPPARFPGQ